MGRKRKKWTSSSFMRNLLTAALLGSGSRCDKPEISNWIYNVITVGDTIIDEENGTVGQDASGPSYLYDNDLFTSYSVPSSLPDEQYIRFDWSHYGESS